MLMAIIRVPRWCFRTMTGLVVTLVGWLVSTAQTAYADITGIFWDDSNNRVHVTCDSDNDTISIYPDGASVIVFDGTNESVVLDDMNNAVYPNSVNKISIDGGAGNDLLDLTSADFDNVLNFSASLNGGAGKDTLKSRDFALSHSGDVLLGGDGADSLIGGEGADDFHAYTFESTASDGDVDVLEGAPDADSDLGYWSTSDNDVANDIEFTG